MNSPVVSVICLCYNHERFIREAIHSVLAQTYREIQIIIVDDASTDNSVSVIRQLLKEYPHIEFLPLKNNLGNCAAFNRGFQLAKGEYIVDFSTDDVLLPERIEKQVKLLMNSGPGAGVIFTDADYIDEEGKHLHRHFPWMKSKGLIHTIPQGDVYADVLSTYFICAPTMLVRRSVFELLEGYDEQLAYEDFDFWVRSSREFSYLYIDEVLTKVRRSKDSLSMKAYNSGDRQLYSTYLVCVKAMNLNRNEKENSALLKRLKYELRHAAMTGNHTEARLFEGLIRKKWKPSFTDALWVFISKLSIQLRWFRSIYQRVRYR